MSSTGKLDRRRRGIGSIIGAIFAALILLSGFTFYTITADVTNHYDKTKESMSEMDWNHNREKLTIKRLEITVATNLNVTVKNEGAVQSHLIWLGIFNKTVTPEDQDYQALNEYIEPGETKSLISSFTIIEGKKYVVQLVTELGNTIMSTFFPASDVSCSLMLMTAPPTVYKGNNVTAWLAVTPNDTEVDVVQDLVVTLSAAPTGLMQLMGNSSLTVSSLTRGTTAFFWWTYNATNSGTVTFNATYIHAPAGAYALSTAQIVSPPKQGDVTITGINCTALQNPSQWNLLGSTQNVSGSISDLAFNDTNYANFSSYYGSASTDTNDFVDGIAANFSSPDKGTHSNFGNQAAKDGNYDTLTEVNTATFPKYYPSSANRLGSTQLVSGNITNLQNNDGVYMAFRSWPSQNSSGAFGNTNTGTDYYPIVNVVVGSIFTATDNGWADSITAYLQITSYAKNVKCAIYKHSDLSLVAYTQERSISTSSSPNWQTFSFTAPKPNLTAGTQYILVAWSSSGSGGDAMFFRQDGTTDQAHYDNRAYGAWPNPFTVDSHGARSYCIYCNYAKPIEYTSEVEFMGASDTQTWSRLIWTLDCSFTTSGVTTTFQLYDNQSGTYPTSGDGYNLTTIGTTDVMVSQTITTNPTYFRDASGNWKLKLTGKKSTSSPFDCNVDLVQYEAGIDDYELDLKEQWTTADYGEPNEYLCIYTGPLSPENLSVDVWTGSAWTTLMTLGSADSNMWKNVSVSSYLISSNFTIRFKGGNETNDIAQDSWNIDATLLHTWYHEYAAEAEFIGSSSHQNWTSLVWMVDSSWNIGSVNVTIQLYDYTLGPLGGYPSSGNGYLFYVSNTTSNIDELENQTITSGATQYENSTGYWKVKIKGVKSTDTQFQMKINWVELQDSYAYAGDNVPYNVWTLYTIQATGASGSPIPFTYASVYANGTTVAFQKATDGTSIPNPAWLQLDANGAFQLQVKSTTSSGETFVLYATVGNVVQQKTITQVAQ